MTKEKAQLELDLIDSDDKADDTLTIDELQEHDDVLHDDVFLRDEEHFLVAEASRFHYGVPTYSDAELIEIDRQRKELRFELVAAATAAKKDQSTPGAVRCTREVGFRIWCDDPVLKHLGYSVMGGVFMWKKLPPWRSEDSAVHLQQYVFTSQDQAECNAIIDSYVDVGGIAVVTECKIRAASMRRFSPAADYIKGLCWDGEKRLETSIPHECIGSNHEYAKQALVNSWLALIQRIFEPGCQVDSMTVLVGKQGTRKTSYVRSFLPWGAYEPKDLPDDSNRDGLMRAHMGNIVLLDEMQKKSVIDDFSAFKAAITTRSDMYRLPYASENTFALRSFVFWGTENEESFIDHTQGFRRFWPIKIVEPIPHDVMSRAFMDQCLAEAFNRYINGDRLDYSDDFEVLANKVRNEHLDDPITQAVWSWLDTETTTMLYDPESKKTTEVADKKDWVSVAYVMAHCKQLEKLNPAKDKKEAKEVATAIDRHPLYECVGEGRVYGALPSWERGVKARKTWARIAPASVPSNQVNNQQDSED